MTNVINEDTFEYFNTDANLLLINVLLEGFYRGQNVFTLNQFFKGESWNIETISEEVQDTNDYYSADELVANQIIKIIEDLKIGTIKRISVKDISAILGEVVEEAVLKKDGTEEDVLYYQAVISEVCELEKYKYKQIEKNISAGKKYSSSLFREVNFTVDNFYKHLQILLSAIPEFIEIEVSFNEQSAKEVHKILDDYIDSFSQDDYINNKPAYQSIRYYFSKQLENFYTYAKTIAEIKGNINIPFSSLRNTNFEIVKILCYLEREQILKVNNWGDENIWNIKVNSSKFNLNNFSSSIQEKNEVSSELIEKAKPNLSFDQNKSQLILGDKIVKIRKMSDQFHLLRIIFESPEDIAQEWFYSEIAEKYDDATSLKDKKFYNAVYQINQKIIRDTGYRDILITTAQSVKINPEYLK